MRGRSRRPQGELNGFLDSGSRMEGELHFEDTFRVDGHLGGKVDSEGDLIVGDRGEVDGELLVGRLFVSGLVRGRVKASRRIEISPGGRLMADIETPVLVLEEGSFFEGNCVMMRNAPANERPVRPQVVSRLPQGREEERGDTREGATGAP